MDCVLWHHPRCSKSRDALALLAARGVAPLIRDYQRDPPSPAELRALLDALGLPAHALLRATEPAYAELALGDRHDDEDAQIQAMATCPQLIQRPVLLVGKRAVIGRPPERVLDLLDGRISGA